MGIIYYSIPFFSSNCLFSIYVYLCAVYVEVKLGLKQIILSYQQNIIIFPMIEHLLILHFSFPNIFEWEYSSTKYAKQYRNFFCHTNLINTMILHLCNIKSGCIETECQLFFGLVIVCLPLSLSKRGERVEIESVVCSYSNCTAFEYLNWITIDYVRT